MSLTVAILTTDKREDGRDYANPTPSFGAAPEALLEGFSLLPDLKVHVISCLQQPVKSPDRLSTNIWYHALHVPKFGWMRTFYQGCIRAVRRKLWEIGTDIVHGQGTERDCSLTAVLSGFPNVLTIHGNMRLIALRDGAKPFSFHWITARLESWAISRSGGVICLSTHTQRAVAGLAKQTWLIPNAVESSFFEVIRSQHRGRPPTIFFPARVCALKNQINFIRALDSMPKPPDFRLIFLGGGQGEDYNEEFDAIVKSRPWCVNMGFVTREKLRMLLPEATAVVLPSLEDNCPMAILEAMAAGVPVAGSRVGGIPDLIEEGVTGLLCDPTSSESMRQMVSQIIENPEAIQRMAKHAQNLARLRFHPRIIAEKHLQIYRELLQPNTSSQ